MTKNEFLSRLSGAFESRGVADAADILEEYESHFAYKLADGYSEEEIAAKLGDPVQLAGQFESPSTRPNGGKKAFTVAGLCLVDLPTRLLFLMLCAFGLVLAAAALAFAVLGVCLLAGQSPYGLLPAMPRASALLFGLALLPLSALTAAGCAWYVSFLRQVARSFGRFQQNALAAASGRAALPALPLLPQFAARKARALRRAVSIALVLFVALFVAGLAASMIHAGSFEFWHVWGWFGYMGA